MGVPPDIYISSPESAIDAKQFIPEGYLPIATSFYAVNGAYACLLKTAYREDHKSYSSGTVLSWFAVKWLLDMDRSAVIDFQKESDAYKFKWGRVKDTHILFQMAMPGNFRAMTEIWLEKNIIPLLRKIKQRL